MHVAAESPEYLAPEEVPADVKAREEEIARGQVKGKPANIIDKIVEGKIKAFYDQVCLLIKICQRQLRSRLQILLAKEAKAAWQTT